MKNVLGCAALAMLAGCATVDIPQGSAATGDPARIVAGSVATRVAGTLVDADDPALWADPEDPSRALLLGTDKTTGLYVHGLDGAVRHFFPEGPLNNVDLRGGFAADGQDFVLVAATERQRFGITTWLLDPRTLELRPWGFVPTDMGEPYGFCMGRWNGAFYLVANNKEGEIRAYRVEAGPAGPSVTLDRTFRVGSQPEGCVVDDRTGHLYVGEEDVAIWRFSLDGPDGASPLRIAATDGERLTADVEGLVLLHDRGSLYLIASSQGDSTFPVWRVEGDRYDYVGRFAVEGASLPAVRGTDGLDAWSGPIGNYPEGALAIHNAEATPAGDQNYVLVDWRDVRAALGLR